MREHWPYVVAFLVAWLGTDLIIPYSARLATYLGKWDMPNSRKIHTKPIPRMGGIAIFLGFILSLITLELLQNGFLTSVSNSWMGIIIGSTLMFFVGIRDDLKPIKARTKLLWQILAALIAYSMGVRIDFISNLIMGGMIMLPWWLSMMVTVFWLVGITNTINLIDGLDGLAAGVATIAGFTLFIIALQKGQIFSALLAITLAGGTLGFLRYNFNPAKIFMGDSGSLFLGFTLAALSVTGVLKVAATVALFIPILILGVPILDTAMAILRRILRKRSIFQPDKSHLHHKLLKFGLSQRRAVIFIYGLSALLAGIALYIVGFSQAWSLLIVSILIILWGIFPFSNLESKSINK